MIFRQLTERRNLTEAGVAISTQNPPSWMVNLFGLGMETTSGVEVTDPVARGYSLFAAGMDAIARPLATVPLVVYRRLERGREKAERHWLYSLLRTSPNPDMSAIDWRERAVGDMILGNSYNAITFDARGTVARIDPLPPDLVEVRLTPTGKVIYERTDTRQAYRPDEMLHFKGPGTGVVGHQTIRRHAQALGGMIAADRFAGSYFGNGATLSGVLEHPAQLSKPAQERLREGFKKIYGNKGGGGAHDIAVLEEAMKFTPIGVDPEKSQLLETRKDNVRQMARILGVPPHRLMDLEDAHFDNIESQNVEFWQSLLYFAEKIEQEIDRKLLKGGVEYYVKHDLRVMLRADTDKRNEAYAKGRQWGYLSANDIRELEDLNPIEGGDEYLAPLNMVPASMLVEIVKAQIENAKAPTVTPAAQTPDPPKEPESKAGPSADEVRERAREAFLPLFREAAERIVRRETGEIRKAARRLLAKPADLGDWLSDFWLHQQEQASRIMGPHMVALGEVCGEPVSEGDVLAWAKHRSEEMVAMFERRLIGEQPAKAIEELLTTIDEKLAASMAAKLAGAEA